MATPNTGAIATGIQTLLQGLSLYRLVKVGPVLDPTDVASYAAITFLDRKTERFDAGWKVNSTPTLQIESGVEMADGTGSELLIMSIADQLSALFVARLGLGGVPGVYLTLTDQADKTGYKMYPNGNYYRVHFTYVKAIQQYNVTVQQ